MTEENETGNLQGIGYGKPPADKQFGKSGGNKINRKGRAVNGFDALRKEWQKIWNEVLLDDKGNPIIDPETKRQMTRLVARMRIATSSRNTKEFEIALAYAYGKPKEQIDVNANVSMTWKEFIENAPKPSTDDK